MRELRLMDGAGWTLTLMSTLLSAAVLSSGAANADGPIQLKSRLGDACLDAPSLIGDIPVVVNPCNGSEFQRWNLNGRQLESVAFPGKCLIKPLDAGNVHIEYCRDAMTQHWTIQPDGQVTNDVGGCLTVLGGPGPGTRVASRNCSGDPSQGWDGVS